jgi:hypothetical protein
MDIKQMAKDLGVDLEETKDDLYELIGYGANLGFTPIEVQKLIRDIFESLVLNVYPDGKDILQGLVNIAKASMSAKRGKPAREFKLKCAVDVFLICPIDKKFSDRCDVAYVPKREGYQETLKMMAHSMNMIEYWN